MRTRVSYLRNSPEAPSKVKGPKVSCGKLLAEGLLTGDLGVKVTLPHMRSGNNSCGVRDFPCEATNEVHLSRFALH